MGVIIIGGGIGGLTAALSLHAAGIDVEVFEAAADVRPLGVGINVLPHAVRELTELGPCWPRPASRRGSCATSPPTHGQEIWREARGLAAGYDWPQYSIHRGRLHMLLMVEARARLGARRVHTGRRLVRTEQDAAGVTCAFRPSRWRPGARQRAGGRGRHPFRRAGRAPAR